jgi:hypothetical protein
MKTLHIFAAMMILAVLVGCDDDKFDGHTVPAGTGSLVIDNKTFTKINVFLGGSSAGRVGDFDELFIDADPGVYRLVLDEDGSGDRAFAENVDILEGRLTVVEVDLIADDDDYRVAIFLHDS